jgi:two-component system LytT family response regulator
MMKAIIIEDEIASRNGLKGILEKYHPTIRLVGNNDLDTVAKGINAIRRFRPDVVFLDIRLSETNEEENGFAILEQTKEIPFEVIILTAYSDYSIRAINDDLRTCYFIRKPFDFEKVSDAVKKVEESLFSKLNLVKQSQIFCTLKGKLGLPTKEGTEYIPLSKFVMLEADGNLTRIWLWLENKPMFISHNIGWFDKQLACGIQSVFFRTHSSFVANRDYVRLFNHDGKKAFLTMENNMIVRISEDRKLETQNWLKEKA